MEDCQLHSKQAKAFAFRIFLLWPWLLTALHTAETNAFIIPPPLLLKSPSSITNAAISINSNIQRSYKSATASQQTSRIKSRANNFHTVPRTQLCALNAHTAHGNNHHRNNLNTARESAVIVEWEPVSELQRRIDEGTHYQHFEEDNGSRSANNTEQDGTNGVEDEVRHRGVFCGYRTTQEEISRLKSADPDDYSVKC